MRKVLVFPTVFALVVGVTTNWAWSSPEAMASSTERLATQSTVSIPQVALPESPSGAKNPTQSAGSVVGTCCESGTGTGVPGIVVRAYSWTKLRRVHSASLNLEGCEVAAEAVSAAYGRFVLSGLEPDSYLLIEADAPLQRAVSFELHPGQSIDGIVLRLTHGAPVSGRVVDGAGHPVEGAWVLLLQHNAVQGKARANAQGEFAFPRAEVSASAAFRATAPTYRVTLVQRDGHGKSLRVGNDGLSDVEIVLHPGKSIEGTLIDDAGNPIPNARLRPQRDEWDVPAITGNDGSFLIIGITGDESSVELRGAAKESELEFLHDTGSVTFGAEAHVKGVCIVARPRQCHSGDEPYYRANQNPSPEMTTGRVVDSKGNGVNAVNVSVARKGPQSDVYSPTPHTVSGPDGKFAIDFGNEEQVDLSVSGRSIVSAVFKGIKAGSKDNVFTVRDLLPIRGAVRDAKSGKAIKEFEVHVLYFRDDDCFEGAGEGYISTYDPDGHFEVYSRSAGSVSLCASAPGCPGPRVEVTPGPSGEFEPVEILLDSARTVTGTVLSSDGTPLAGVRVVACRPEGGGAPGPGELGATDASGAFCLDGLAARKYQIVAMPEGYVHSPYDVDLSNQSTAEVRLVLQKTGIIRGHVLRDGKPVAKEFVGVELIVSPAEKQSPFSRCSYDVWTDADGTYMIENVDPGRYEVRCDAFGTNRAVDYVKYEITVGTDAATEVDFP